jgi:hypothetical protein
LAAPRRISIGDAILAEQPAVDNMPFVPPPRREFQQPGACILQLEKELERLPASRLVALDRVPFDPDIPFLNQQVLGFFLFHNTLHDLLFEAAAEFEQGLQNSFS